MTRIITLSQIKEALTSVPAAELMQSIEDGFVAYSQNQVVVPPVGHLQFREPSGDVHIKYGYIRSDDYYVIKVASSFYENPTRGLPSSNGSMHVYDQKTGEYLAILLDEGYLTDVRTALAGAVVARHLAPSHVEAIGIVGTGTQARFQLQYLKEVINCRKVYVWGRSEENLQRYRKDVSVLGFEVTTTRDMNDITSHCNYIVTATPSTQPLIRASTVRSGTHITAMGADAEPKQEIDPEIMSKADIVIADSLTQSIDHGEVSHAIQQGIIQPEKLIELGDFIKRGLRREGDKQITVADLTGVAVQDIQIAKLVLEQARTLPNSESR